MNITQRPGGLRWTFLSFAVIGIAIWVIAVVLLFRAATPAVNDLMSGLSATLNSGADSLEKSSVAVDQGSTLMSGLEPGLNSTANGLEASSNSLTGTKDAINEMSDLLSQLSDSLQVAGSAMALSPALRDAAQALTDAGESMDQASQQMRSVAPELDAVIAQVHDVRQVVINTSVNTGPLADSLDKTQLSLSNTSVKLRGTADQLDSFRDSNALRFALIMVFILLGMISISLAVIAATRLTQMNEGARRD